jgi:hypothetical protein
MHFQRMRALNWYPVVEPVKYHREGNTIVGLRFKAGGTVPVVNPVPLDCECRWEVEAGFPRLAEWGDTCPRHTRGREG